VKKPWTREEIKELIALYPDTDIEVLMQKFGRSYRSIICKATALQVRQSHGMRAKQGKRAHLKAVGPRKPRKFWPSNVLKEILAAYPDTSNEELAAKYNTTPRAICCLANNRNLKKSKQYLGEAGRRAALRLNEMIRKNKAERTNTLPYDPSKITHNLSTGDVVRVKGKVRFYATVEELLPIASWENRVKLSRPLSGYKYWDAMELEKL